MSAENHVKSSHNFNFSKINKCLLFSVFFLEFTASLTNQHSPFRLLPILAIPTYLHRKEVNLKHYVTHVTCDTPDQKNQVGKFNYKVGLNSLDGMIDVIEVLLRVI